MTRDFDHGYLSSETVIFIEIQAMCINYQFWNILKNLLASLDQSGVSMIIAESSKDVNPGFYPQKWLNSPIMLIGGLVSLWIVFFFHFLPIFAFAKAEK